jgi:iron(III) transport system permease protein
VFAVVGLLPLALMGLKSVVVDGRLSLHYYRGLFASGRASVLLANSVKLAFWTTALVTAVGVPLGILFGKTDLPARRTFAALFTVPLLAPPYIMAVSWYDVLGSSSAWLFGLPGCIRSRCSAP